MLRNIGIVYSKELLDTIRDRRTIISMIVVPIMVFPLITVGFSSFVSHMLQKTQEEKQRVLFIGREYAPTLYAVLDTSSEVELATDWNLPIDSVAQAILGKSIKAAVVVAPGF